MERVRKLRDILRDNTRVTLHTYEWPTGEPPSSGRTATVGVTVINFCLIIKISREQTLSEVYPAVASFFKRRYRSRCAWPKNTGDEAADGGKALAQSARTFALAISFFNAQL